MAAEPMSIERKIWTYDEIALIEDDVRRELYDGEIFELPRPTIFHQNTLAQLAFALEKWARTRGGKTFVGPIDLFRSPTQCYIPDVVFYRTARFNLDKVAPDGQKFVLAPDVIAEVLSPSTRRNDRFSKMRAYADFGVPNYWILDTENQTLEAFELQNGVYQTAAFHENGEIFAPAAFPELAIELARVFDL